jgi:hypothetical protein
LASKVMEYLAADRTVLALAPPGATADLVEQTHAGIVVQPRDIPAIRNAILSLYARWKVGTLRSEPDQQRIRELAWPAIAGQFADVLEDAVLHPARARSN